MLEIILISAGIVAVTGLLLGGVIGFAAKKFEVFTDPRIEEVQNLLPGANCGGCGYAGCAALAEAIVLNGVESSSCPVCSPENRCAIAALLGKESSTSVKKVAVVFCGGSISRAWRNAKYNGVTDCRSASIVGNGGGKACRFGCIGFGSCARACPFGAIEMRDGLAVVHPEICVGCGKCVDECPRRLVRLVPETAKVHVYCNSLDKPVMKRKNCSVPCITCRKCVKAAPDQMQIQAQLVRVNYSDPPDVSIIEKAQCPTECLQTEESHRHLVPRSPQEKK